MNTDLSTTKEETRAAANDDINTCASRISKQQQAVSTAASTASWSRLKDPRIVRVSRAFGGKDRHSKVCTVRGLRDRRVRLSVPTAIQLYDLQDRLGLNQPSKVVDWLLNEAKEAIDELPPLQIPQGSLISSQSNIVHHPMFMNSQVHRSHEFLSPQSDKYNNKGLKIINDVSGETSHHHRRHEERSQLDPSNNFMRQSLPFPSLFNGSYNPNNLVRWDPSNMTESSSTSSQNNEDIHHHSFSLVQLSSHDVPAAGSHHPAVLVYHHHHQPAAAGAPPSSSGPCTDFHGLQLSNSSSLITSPVDVRPFHQFHTTTANLLPNEQSNRNHHQFHSS